MKVLTKLEVQGCVRGHRRSGVLLANQEKQMCAEIQMHFDPSVFALGDKVCLQLRPHLTDLLHIRAISSGEP